MCEIRNPSFFPSPFQRTKSHMESDQENQVDESFPIEFFLDFATMMTFE
jgi:hypothetical protein